MIHIRLPIDEELHNESERLFFHPQNEMYRTTAPSHTPDVHYMPHNGEGSLQRYQPCPPQRWLPTTLLYTQQIIPSLPTTEQSFQTHQHHSHPFLPQSIPSLT